MAKVAAILVGISAGVVLLGWLSIRADSVKQADKAKQIIGELGALRIATPGAADATAIVRQFSGAKVRYVPTIGMARVACRDADESYAITIAPSLAERVISFVPLVERLRLVHDWKVYGGIQMKGGVLLCVTDRVLSVDYYGKGTVVDVAMSPRPPWARNGENREVGFGGRQPIDEVEIDLFPEANQLERDSAFNPDIDCLTSLRGCRYGCQVMPTAWHYFLTTPDWRHLVLGYGRPPEADDPSCRAK